MSHIAKAAIVGRGFEATVFESNMMRLRLARDAELRPTFLILVLALKRSWRHFQLHAKRAVAQASVNQQDVRSLLVPVPPTLEQVGIERRVGQVVSALERYEQQLSDLSRVKDGLLQDLLTGKVRVSP
jgi:type I restriction enzyme S subunit